MLLVLGCVLPCYLHRDISRSAHITLLIGQRIVLLGYFYHLLRGVFFGSNPTQRIALFVTSYPVCDACGGKVVRSALECLADAASETLCGR